jgi:hypothetical protein
MLHLAYGVLACFGLWLNRSDRRMLALTALVVASVFVEPPTATAEAFYSFCIASEVTIAALALMLRCRASVLIAEVCAVLVIAHFMGYAYDAGSHPLSPYRGIVKLLESIQLLACVALSPILAPLLRNHDATTT